MDSSGIGRKGIMRLIDEAQQNTNAPVRLEFDTPDRARRFRAYCHNNPEPIAVVDQALTPKDPGVLVVCFAPDLFTEDDRVVRANASGIVKFLGDYVRRAKLVEDPVGVDSIRPSTAPAQERLAAP